MQDLCIRIGSVQEKNLSMYNLDEKFMREALLEAKKAFAKEEVPIGAILVYQDEIIGRSHNLVEQNQDASCHAELLCLQEGAKQIGNWRLLETTLYCTIEPCAMCAGAMILSRIGRLVYGAPDLRHGANGSIFHVLDRPHPIHALQVTAGVCAEEASDLLKSFFKKRRAEV